MTLKLRPASGDYCFALMTDIDSKLDGSASRLKYRKATHRREWAFPFGSFDSWIEALEGMRDRIKMMPTDNADYFHRWQYALTKNATYFKQAIAERNRSCLTLLLQLVKESENKQRFINWARSAVPPDCRAFMTLSVCLDVARYACRGVNGFADRIQKNPNFFDYLQQLSIFKNNIEVGPSDEVRKGAEEMNAYLEEVLATMMDYEYVPIYQVKRIYKPFQVTPEEAKVLQWLWCD